MATVITNNKVYMKSSEYDKFIDTVYQKKEKRNVSSRAKATAKRIEAIKNLKINGYN